MSLGHGASIVRDGLVLHLDAANIKSYPGSGTAWSDLSGNGYDGTLTNGPLYSADNNGYITFDGVNDYINVGDTGTNFGCIQTWVYLNNTITSSSTAMSLLKYGTTYQSSLGFGSITSFATSETLTFLYAEAPSTGFYKRTYIRDNISSGWNQIVVQWNGSSYDFYINANKKVTYSGTQGAAPQDAINNLQIGRIDEGNNNYFSGRFSQLSVYNTALSEADIQKNFNALRGRYGI